MKGEVNLKRRMFIVLVNGCAVATLAIFAILGYLDKRQLLIVAPVSILILNIAAVIGLRRRKGSL